MVSNTKSQVEVAGAEVLPRAVELPPPEVKAKRNENLTARARAVVTVEIPIGGTWGSECRLSQVHDQAADEARGAIRNALTSVHRPAGFRIVGDIVVTAVLVEEVRRGQ